MDDINAAITRLERAGIQATDATATLCQTAWYVAGYLTKEGKTAEGIEMLTSLAETVETLARETRAIAKRIGQRTTEATRATEEGKL